MSGESRCVVCGEPMPPGEEMFNYHGYSGPCPKEPFQRPKEDGFERFRQCVSDWRTKAKASKEESGRIRSTAKVATDAEERCNVMAEIWEQCATDLEATIKDSTGKS